MSELTGSSRGKLLSGIQKEQPYKIAKELYRPIATVSDGGIATKLMQEYYSGSSTHLQKAAERLKNINELINSGTLGMNDLDIAEASNDALEMSVALFK